MKLCQKSNCWGLFALIMMENNFDFIRANDLTPNASVAELAESKNILRLLDFLFRKAKEG